MRILNRDLVCRQAVALVTGASGAALSPTSPIARIAAATSSRSVSLSTPLATSIPMNSTLRSRMT